MALFLTHEMTEGVSFMSAGSARNVPDYLNLSLSIRLGGSGTRFDCRIDSRYNRLFASVVLLC